MGVDPSVVDSIAVSTWTPGSRPWIPDQRNLADTLVPFARHATQPWSIRSDEFRPALELGSQIQTTVGHALRLTAALARRLAVLHDHGWVYGRIGPGTVWANRTLDRVALLPLHPFREGAPLRADEQEEFAALDDAEFLAPEFRVRPMGVPSRSTDLFGLGAFLFWACTGRNRVSLPVDPNDLSEAGGAGLETVSEVINRLADLPGRRRYATARGVAADLHQCLRHFELGGPPSIQVLGQQDGAPAIAFGATLIGRDNELATLRRALRSARRSAATAFVTGPPGVGKTRLVQEFERSVVEGRGVFVGGKSDQFAMEEPLSSLTKSLGSLARWAANQPTQSRHRTVDRLRAELGGLEGVICALAPEFGTLLGNQGLPPEIGPEQQTNRFKDAVVGLLRGFANRNRPLCIFLDDMQWADLATLDLVEMLFGDPSLAGILFVGAFRDNDPAHLAALGRAEAALGRHHPVSHVGLAGLGSGSVSKLIDQVGRSEEERAGLAAYLHDRTGGNPFYVHQVVEALLSRRLVWYDFPTGSWRCDLGAIEAQDTGADVANIVARRLSELSDDCRRLLATAAFLGASFPRRLLAHASAMPSDAFRAALDEAFAIGAIQAAMRPGEEDLDSIQFTHDRVQSAATSLIDPTEAQQLRRDIGHALLDTLDDIGSRSLFVVVNNINRISEDLSDRQRTKLAELNLAAGRRARETLAFEEAFLKLSAGTRLLTPESWKTDRRLCVALHLETFGAAYLSGRFDDAQRLFDLLMTHVDSDLEAADVYNTKILLETAAQRNNDAVDAAVVALGKLGWRFNKTIRRAGIIVEFLRVRWLMRRHSVESYVELRTMEDERLFKVLTILTSVSPAAYFVNPNLTILAGLKIVAISARAGNSPLSPSGYVLFGLGHVALGAFVRGDALGRLALALAERLPDPVTRPKVQIIYGAFVGLWQRPISECLNFLRIGYDGAVAVGDRQYAYYGILLQWFLNFFRGKDLEVLQSDFRKRLHFINQSRDPFVIGSYAVWSGAVRLLRDEAEPGEPIMKSAAAGDAFVERMLASNNLTAVGYYLVMRLQLECLFGSPGAALGYGDRASRYLDAMPGQIMLADYAFYRAIAAAMLGRRLKLLNRGLKKFRRLAAMVPANFEPHRLLLEAETMAIRGHGTALSAFEAAIEAADRAGMPNIAGLAAFRAADASRKLGSSRSRSAYLEEARKRFAAWKATALVKRALADLAEAPASLEPPGKVVELNRTGVIEHALGKDVELAERIPVLLRAVADETGADAAWLVWVDDGQPAVIAQSRDGISAMCVGQESRIQQHSGLRGDIIDLVRRTGHDLMIADTAADPRFARDDATHGGMVYCGARHVSEGGRALLFLTSARAGHLSDDLVRDLRVATSELGNVLLRQRSGQSLDSHQVALRRAAKKLQLMEHLRQQLETFATKRYANDFLNGGGREIEEQRETVVSSLFLDIQGYTLIVESIGAANSKRLVEEYFSAFYDDILKMGGEISQIEGDSLLAIFDGDESPHRAVKTALLLRRATRRLNLVSRHSCNVTVNIGVNTGQAIVGCYKIAAKDVDRRLFTAIGSSVNVAARIAAHARDGAILVGEQTKETLPEGMDLKCLGPVQLKNVSTPTVVFEVRDEVNL
ncbi:MAG: AAA family ATPase [Bauldia sp.]|nr:AAA family ATPase [Bauldia sp.]